MTLADFASLSTAISGIAVTLSVIYLALQVHQNTKHTRALIHQGRASRFVDLQIAASNADISAVLIIGHGGEPSPEEIKRRQFRIIWQAFVTHFEEVFYQHKNGLLEEEVYQSWSHSVRLWFSQSGNAAEWNGRKALKPPVTDFGKFVDEIISKPLTTPTSQPSAATGSS